MLLLKVNEKKLRASKYASSYCKTEKTEILFRVSVMHIRMKLSTSEYATSYYKTEKTENSFRVSVTHTRMKENSELLNTHRIIVR